MTIAIQRRTRNLFVWVALIPILLAGLGYWTRIRFKNTLDEANRSQEAVLLIDDVVESTTLAETGQRGFLLTGKEDYLKPFEEGRAQVDNKIKQLRSMIADDPAQRQNLERLEALVHAKMEELRLTIELRRHQDLSAALETVNTDKGFQLMQEIAALGRSMSAEERGELASRLQASVWLDRAVDLSFGAFTVAALLLLVWAGRLIRDYADERERAEAAVTDLNRSLEQRVAERTRELEESNRNLSRSNADLERFAYVVGHDLREPLRMVASYVGLLQRRYHEKLDEKADEYILYAVQGARRMQALIDDLLGYARVSAQGLTLEPTNLEVVLDDALQNLKAGFDESGAAVTRDPLPSLPADRVKLTQVFQNLIGNAIKFRDPERRGAIHVGAKQTEDGWEISIEDNGVGFDPQYADRIFIIFQRLHPASEYSGTGIGLAVCKRIVEAHRGRIWCDSKVGKGSTFRFILPVSSDGAGQCLVGDVSRQPGRLRGPAAG